MPLGQTERLIIDGAAAAPETANFQLVGIVMPRFLIVGHVCFCIVDCIVRFFCRTGR